MRKPTIVLAALPLLAVVTLCAARYQEPSPRQVVEEYCKFASAGDLEQVAKYATRYPRYVWDAEMKEMNEQARKGREAAAVGEPQPGGVGVYRVRRPDEDDSYSTIVKRTFPQFLSKYPENRQVLKDVTGVWVKGNEARVRTIIGYEGTPNDRFFQWEFYLYKEEARGWKIFKIDTPKQKETYAVPDNTAAANNY